MALKLKPNKKWIHFANLNIDVTSESNDIDALTKTDVQLDSRRRGEKNGEEKEREKMTNDQRKLLELT